VIEGILGVITAVVVGAILDLSLSILQPSNTHSVAQLALSLLSPVARIIAPRADTMSKSYCRAMRVDRAGCLLLLHLLELEQRRGRGRGLLRALDQDRPIFGDGHVPIQRGWFIKGRHLDSDVKLAVRTSTIDTSRRWNVRVIATYSGSDVSLMGEQIVCWIEPNPPKMGKECFNPCVRGI
jgi:hypothetical protein